MGRVVREFYDFVFDRRAIPRADAANQIQSVKRRKVQILPHERVGSRVGLGQIAGQLRSGKTCFARVGKEQRGRAGRLDRHGRVIDALLVDSRRRPRLEALRGEAQLAERLGQPGGGGFAEAPFGADGLSAKRLSAEERPRCKDDPFGGERGAPRRSGRRAPLRCERSGPRRGRRRSSGWASACSRLVASRR